MKKEKVKDVIKKPFLFFKVLLYRIKGVCVCCLSFLFVFFVLKLPFLNADVGTNPDLNPLIVSSIPDLIILLLEKIVIPIGIIVATLAIVYSGFLFVTSQGSPDKISKAKAAFFWGIVGGLILLGSLAIARIIESTVIQITQ